MPCSHHQWLCDIEESEAIFIDSAGKVQEDEERLANMMMELEVSWILYPHVKSLCFAQELPAELLNQPACQEILAQYGQSFKDVLSFENIPNNPESHEMFNQMLTNIRQRHQVSLVRSSMISRGS